jgi:hypothetical protein
MREVFAVIAIEYVDNPSRTLKHTDGATQERAGGESTCGRIVY